MSLEIGKRGGGRYIRQLVISYFINKYSYKVNLYYILPLLLFLNIQLLLLLLFQFIILNIVSLLFYYYYYCIHYYSNQLLVICYYIIILLYYFYLYQLLMIMYLKRKIVTQTRTFYSGNEQCGKNTKQFKICLNEM